MRAFVAKLAFPICSAERRLVTFVLQINHALVVKWNATFCFESEIRSSNNPIKSTVDASCESFKGKKGYAKINQR